MKSLASFLDAQSIAIIGASSHPEKVGYQILRNVLAGKEHHHRRKIYPINPTAKSILGLPAFAQLRDVKEPVQLVIIVTPAVTVPELVDGIIDRNRQFSADKKTEAVVVISAGFAEIDKKGKNIQHMIATKLCLAGIRLLGPNSLGFICPPNHLNASFANRNIPDGNLAVVSQSGAMLTALFDALENRQVGISFAVSLGNKADVNENDCLEFAMRDPRTSVVVMYLESFTYLPRFFELSSRLSKKKPILLLKGGVSERGQQASASHTAALATNQVLLAAAAKQMGFAMVENMEELVNIAFFLAKHRQLPENVMVITNAGGPAVNTVDELEKSRVPLAQWSDVAKKDFEKNLPRITPHNPCDLLGDAQPEDFRAALSIAQHDVNIESILITVTPQAVTNMNGIVQEIIQQQGRKPIFVSLIGGDHLEPFRQKLRAHQIMSTPFPNDLATILQSLKELGEYKYQKETFFASAPHTPATPPETETKKIVHARPLPTLDETFQLLQSVGIRVPAYTIITSDQGSFETLAYPLFVKTANLSLLHKKKIGAVYGVVKNAEEARIAYQKMSPFGNDVLFQELIDIENELLIGFQNDTQFGLFLTVGLGGELTNVLADRAYSFLPTTKKRLEEAWKTTKAYQLFAQKPDLSGQVVDTMQKIQKLIMKNPWIKSLEINPLAIGEKGIWAADVKIQV